MATATLAKKNAWTDRELAALPETDHESCARQSGVDHGTRAAWLVNWRKEQVHLFTPDSIEALTRPADILTGGEVVPGFKGRLNRIFRSG